MKLEIEHLRLAYGDVEVVKDLSIFVKDGDLLVLLGPSGCGKTSTIRAVAGLEEPKSGRIVVGDKVLFDGAIGVNIPPNKRDMSMVFQSYAIWPHMTVGQNVEFPLRMARVRREERAERVDAALQLVGLGGFQKRRSIALSGGQMQRVALARALVVEPSVLLLDEPLSNLDAKLRDELRFELRELQQRLGVTTVYVTHDQDEALALGDELVIMNHGEIIQRGRPDDVYRRPGSAFVARFFGTVNQWQSKVAAVTDEHTIINGVGSLEQFVVAGNYGTVGTNVSVSIRPQHIRLSRPGECDAELLEHAVIGSVVLARLLGTRIRYRINIGAGTTIDVIGGAESGQHFFDVGDPVVVELPGDSLFVHPIAATDVSTSEPSSTSTRSDR